MPIFRKPKYRLIARMTRSKPYLFVMGWILRGIVEALYATLRVEFRGLSTVPKKSIIALWHNQLSLAPLIPKRFRSQPFTIVVSKSRDGQLLSAYLKTYSNITIVQVSHLTRHAALLQMLGELEKNRIIMITPDGPRGPAFVVKPGTCFSSQHGNAPIIPMQWHASREIVFNTWDKLRLPRPFSKIYLTLKEPIAPSETSAEELALALQLQ